MVVRCSVHLHGEAADAAGNIVTRCSVHEPLTYEALRAVYPFAGRFHFRVRRKLEGEDVWYDVREGEAIELDDPKRCDIRALCVDFDDDRWDGPAARGGSEPRRGLLRGVCLGRGVCLCWVVARVAAARARVARAGRRGRRHVRDTRDRAPPLTELAGGPRLPGFLSGGKVSWGLVRRCEAHRARAQHYT